MLTLDRAKELLGTTTTEEHLFLHAKNVMATTMPTRMKLLIKFFRTSSEAISGVERLNC